MILKSFSFVEFPGKPHEWTLEKFTFSKINLVVGLNATGKTRVLNVISSFAKLFCGAMNEPPGSGVFDGDFEQGSTSWRYHLEYDGAEILRETLEIDGAPVLTRSKGGAGEIRADAVGDKPVFLRFKASHKQLAVVAKRDSIQHPFLEQLYEWGNSLRHFQFGYEMRPHNFAFAVKDVAIEIDEKDTRFIVPIFGRGIDKFGDVFRKSIIADMNELGYPLDDIAIRKPDNVTVAVLGLQGDLVGLSAHELELPAFTDQHNMSQGMFRALSLIIQLTYYCLAEKSGCILIDDIGEGLDFERSCTLIDLVRAKAKHSSFQLIMSTNNHFVMNKVPLEEWCVVNRAGQHVHISNYANSRTAFERFKVTGLNNFDLLATHFLEGR